MWKRATSMVLVGALGLSPLAGCESLPGGEKEQGAVIGGVGGAAAGAAIAKDNRALGALIGAALGAGGGYLVGAKVDKDRKSDDGSDAEIRADAQKAAEKAKSDPATADDVEGKRTADLNDDGFVTLDEVAAMEKAELSDREMITRLERTQQFFELTSDQEKYLRDRGVSDEVITAMRDMKPDDNDARLASDRETTETNVEMRTDRERK